MSLSSHTAERSFSAAWLLQICWTPPFFTQGWPAPIETGKSYFESIVTTNDIFRQTDWARNSRVSKGSQKDNIIHIQWPRNVISCATWSTISDQRSAASTTNWPGLYQRMLLPNSKDDISEPYNVRHTKIWSWSYLWLFHLWSWRRRIAVVPRQDE